MFERLMQLIEGHANYGPALREAAGRKARLVLNYHTHGPEQDYCVSICEQARNVLPVLGQLLPLSELAHIKGVGKTEDQCEVLMTELGDELQRHYELDQRPAIYLNGSPLPDA
jgi:hypothetical protein